MFKLKSLFRFLTGQNFTLHLDSGGGGGGGGTTKTETSNIPEYARPYVETMLGAAQNEMFNYETDAEGNKTPTSLKGYTPFSTDVNDYFGGFQPLQQDSFAGAKNLGPAAQTGDASTMAGQVGMRALNTSYDPMKAGYQSFGGEQAGQYMSPYLEAAMNPQIAAAQRTSQMEGQKQQADAATRGAYGGSRDALMRMERERNLGSQIEGIRSKGYQDAFTNAQSQFNADQARAMTAQQANINQQQFGADLGLKGLQQAGQAASTLGTLGQQQFGQQQSALELQNKFGTQQQQFEQAKKDQEIKDFANEQQWAMQQLGNMNSLLRGLPMQSTTTQSYQAAPSGTSQAIGAATALAGAATKRAGGKIKEKKPSAGLAAGALKRAMKG